MRNARDLHLHPADGESPKRYARGRNQAPLRAPSVDPGGPGEPMGAELFIGGGMRSASRCNEYYGLPAARWSQLLDGWRSSPAPPASRAGAPCRRSGARGRGDCEADLPSASTRPPRRDPPGFSPRALSPSRPFPLPPHSPRTLPLPTRTRPKSRRPLPCTSSSSPRSRTTPGAPRAWPRPPAGPAPGRAARVLLRTAT